MLKVVPSEELPLYHMKPASQWLLLGMRGCNLRCTFCNTWQYSQSGGVAFEIQTPEQLVARAKSEGVCGIAFGVNEPAIAQEFVEDVFRTAREAGLLTHLATSGEWRSEAFGEILALTDCLTFGMKRYNPQFLTQECGGHLESILLNIETALARRVHSEITWLVTEEPQGAASEADEFAAWLAERRPRTPVTVLPLAKDYSWRGNSASATLCEEVREVFGKRLAFAYLKAPESAYMNTRCAGCGRVLVWRGAAGTTVSDGCERHCPGCSAPVPYAL